MTEQPILLEPIYDGDTDGLIDFLIAVARRQLRDEQSVVESEHPDQQAA